MRRYCRFFFFNDTATTEIYTLSLHDALPISSRSVDFPDPFSPTRIETGLSNWSVRPTSEEMAGTVNGNDAAWAVEGSRRVDRKSTRLNSSHANISYAVFCLKKKNHTDLTTYT